MAGTRVNLITKVLAAGQREDDVLPSLFLLTVTSCPWDLLISDLVLLGSSFICLRAILITLLTANTVS